MGTGTCTEALGFESVTSSSLHKQRFVIILGFQMVVDSAELLTQKHRISFRPRILL